MPCARRSAARARMRSNNAIIVPCRSVLTSPARLEHRRHDGRCRQGGTAGLPWRKYERDPGAPSISICSAHRSTSTAATDLGRGRFLSATTPIVVRMETTATVQIDWNAQLVEPYAAWITGVRGLGADGLAHPCGPAEGPWADAPMAALVLHINREVIHHGAEIGLLRDLYRWRTG